MKKSEFIKKVSDELHKTLYEYDIFDGDIDRIIEIAEDLGMLPPPDYRAIIIRKPKWEDE